MTDHPIFEKLRKLATPHHLHGRVHTEAEIKAAEKRLGVRFPQDYRIFLLEYSNISLPIFDMIPFRVENPSIKEDLIYIHKTFGVNNLIPFAIDNGDFYCFETNGDEINKIVFWSNDFVTHESWNSFTDWVEQEWIQLWLEITKQEKASQAMSIKQTNFVTAIITNTNDDVLMIYVQGDTDEQPYWSLPGGRVEKGETAASALLREIKEETGIQLLSTGTIAYQTEMQFDDRKTYATVYHVGIDDWSGTINPNDPEGEILKAAWIPLETAIEHLQKIDYPPMSEPPIAYLSKTAEAGKTWHYHITGNGAQWVSNDE